MNRALEAMRWEAKLASAVIKSYSQPTSYDNPSLSDRVRILKYSWKYRHIISHRIGDVLLGLSAFTSEAPKRFEL